MRGVERQSQIYVGGVSARRPKVPIDPAELERRAEEAMTEKAFAYVAAGAGLELVPEGDARIFQLGDPGLEVIDFQHEPVPSAGLLRAPVGHGARSGSPGTAQYGSQAAQGHAGERRRRLALHLESQPLRVEREGTFDVLDLVPDPRESQRSGRLFGPGFRSA